MRTVRVPNEIMIPQVKESIDAGHTATIRVRGNSMRLFLKDGRDKVVLAPCDEVKVRDVVLAEVASARYVLHRVIAKRGDRLVLMGDGNVRGTESCAVGDVIGKAVGFLRKGRGDADSVEGWKWRVYSRVWLALTPLRRYVLWACRHLGL